MGELTEQEELEMTHNHLKTWLSVYESYTYTLAELAIKLRHVTDEEDRRKLYHGIGLTQGFKTEAELEILGAIRVR